MKDFRDRIKNHKASPSDQAWERMLIKKEKKGIRKTKSFLYVLVALNTAALIFWSMQIWNTPSIDDTNTTEFAKSNNETIIDNNKDSKKIIELTQLSTFNSERINSLTTENNKLKNQITQLRQSLEISKLKMSNLVNQRNTSDFVLRPTVPTVFKASENVIEEEKMQEANLINNSIRLFPLPSINNNSIQSYLIDLATEKKPSIPYFYNELIVNDRNRKWYLSLGTNYENLVEEKQRSIVVGLHRSLNKRFDVGMTLEYSNDRERSNYRVNNDVIDQQTEALGYLMVRYKAFRFNKFIIHADAGIGYRFGNFSFRSSTTIENELQHYNDVRKYQGMDYLFGLGTMYRISPQFDLGARFYLDGNLHSNINLNYRF